MARPIDAEKYMELLKEQYLHYKAMKHGESARAWQGAMQLLYDMPTLTPQNEWVSVEDRLPEKGENVLVYAIAKHIGVTKISIDKLEEGERRPVWLYTHGWFEVTHWMPLPAPPAKE